MKQQMANKYQIVSGLLKFGRFYEMWNAYLIEQETVLVEQGSV